jgi:hypothetical protein
VQNWTIAKNSDSLVGRTVLLKSSVRRAACLFQRRLAVETKNFRKASEASINLSRRKREMLLTNCVR